MQGLLLGKWLAMALETPRSTFRDSYAIAALVLSYSEKTKNPWHLTQAIFGELYKHMNFAKENVKETLLLAIGSVGK